MELAAAFLFCFGSFIVFVAAVGVWRFPDTITRMAATSKGLTLGGLLFTLAALLSPRLAEHRPQLAFMALFLFVAGPVASHLLARAGLLRKMPLSPNTQQNDFHFYEKEI